MVEWTCTTCLETFHSLIEGYEHLDKTYHASVIPTNYVTDEEQRRINEYGEPMYAIK